MDPDTGAEPQKAVSLQWKSYKLVQDPAIRRVTQKVYRYDGVHFSVPDSGFPPVGDLRDPRPRRLWSRYTEMSLPVPKFKLDEFYVGPIPLKEVTFARLNDNIKEPFLAEMCAKFGEVEEMEILFHPKTRKHLGLARVLFTSTRGAKDTVKHLHNTSVMGNIIHAQLDIKGQQRQKYYDLIVNGSYTPQTVPLGGKALQAQAPAQPPPQTDTSSEIRRRLSSELAVLAAGVQALTAGALPPVSAPSDPGFSEPRLDTPYTPGSSTSSQGGAGTPHSSRSGTPFSQDSGYAGNRHSGFSSGSGYPPQDMLPSSSSSSAVSSSAAAGGYKVSRFPPDDLQDSAVHYRGRPLYPPTSTYRPNEPPPYPPPYPHMGMPPPPHQYEQLSERERERERDGRYNSSRRSSYHHQQDSNSSSSSSSTSLKYSHHSHHHRDERGYSRRDSTGSRSGEQHGGRHHRNHHHSHNHHSRRRSSHDRDRERDRDQRDGDYSNSDPRHNSYRSSSNSMSPPPPSSSSSYKDPAAAQDSRSERVAPAPPPAAASNSDKPPHNPPAPPPPAPPPLPPAAVMAAAVAESLDFSRDSPKEQWTKPKPPKTPPPLPQPPSDTPPQPPAVSSSSSSSESPAATNSLPLNISLPPPSPPRDSASPEPDPTNESLPFVYHSSSLDSRIEMLLKEQKAKFSFLASDEEEDGDGERKGGANEAADGVERERRKGDRGRKRGKGGGGEERKKSPSTVPTAASSSSTAAVPYPEQAPPPDDAQASVLAPSAPEGDSAQAAAVESERRGARTPPYNGQSQASPHSSGEDMEISDEEEGETPAISTPHAAQNSGSSPSSAQASSQNAPDASSSSSPPPPDFGSGLHPPMPSYPPHLPPPPPPGYSLQPPPPPGIPPPPPHMELHPEYPPPLPPHMFDYASSVELMNQYTGGAPMSFQMQTHMLGRLHQMRLAASSATSGLTPGPGEGATADYNSYHLHSLPPPHPFMEGEGGTAHYDQDHRYMPPHVPYPYHPDPHGSQIPPPPVPPPHGLPPPAWPPLPPHFPFMPPPGYGTVLPAAQDTGAAPDFPSEEPPPAAENPHEATVQLVLASLIQEMKNIMQRDLNRKMVENVAFNTFDEWWERKETMAKPFQTMVRGVSALRDEEKKEEKLNKPREPLMSLVDWAKSGGVEAFSLRGALRLPSFKVKRKEPLEMDEEDMKRPRPQTPPEDQAERRRPDERLAAERDNKRRKKKPRNRKPWELDSEGEETSDESSSEKDEEESEKDSDDEALSADSDDESLSSSSSGSSSSSSSESEDEEGERLSEDTMDDSTMDSTADTDRSKLAASGASAEAQTGDVKPIKSEPLAAEAPPKRPPSPPVVLVPPLKKRRKNVSFSTDEPDTKPPAPPAAVPLSPPPLSPPPSTPRPAHAIQLLPFASKPGSGTALILPPSSAHDAEDAKKPHLHIPASSSPSPSKSPNKRGGKDSPKSPLLPPASPLPPPPPPIMVCRTVQNLPLDHASMCKMAYEEVPAPLPAVAKRGKGRKGQSPVAAQEEEDENRLRGASGLLQLATAAPTADLSVLADVALKMDPGEAGDSEETETSDEAEEHKLEDPYCPEALAVTLCPEGVLVFIEHSYCRPPHAAPAARRPGGRQAESVLLPADLNAIAAVLEAPEEVIEEAAPGEEARSAQAKKKKTTAAAAAAKSSYEREKERSRKRRRDKENVEHSTKRKETPSKKQRRRKQEESEEEVDVEELESGELSSSSDSDDELRQRIGSDELRKSERLFLQEAGVTTKPLPSEPPLPAPARVRYDNRSEFEQMTILYDIWNSGLDTEDLALLRTTYEKLLQDDHGSDWLNDTHWVNHTVTNLPNPRRKKKTPDSTLREHVTGCARSEGYYAISRKEKDVYLDLDLPEQVIREVENTDTTGTNRLLSERRSEQRRLLTVIGTAATLDSDLLKLNQLKFRKKKLRFGRSRIHEWGLFAMEPIAADEMVIEYVGQNIRQMVADNREKRYAQQGIGSSYLFRVDHDTIIDATKCGNLARFINHCCTPNCYAKVITIESQKKIVIYSKQPIAVNEEITYDYKFPLEENKIPCLCGTENCRGTLN